MANIEKTLRASVRMSNADDALRWYDISAEVAIENGEEQSVTRISAGVVKAEETMIATFYDEHTSRSVSYYGLAIETQNEVNNVINAFVEDVKAKVAEPATVSL